MSAWPARPRSGRAARTRPQFIKIGRTAPTAAHSASELTISVARNLSAARRIRPNPGAGQHHHDGVRQPRIGHMPSLAAGLGGIRNLRPAAAASDRPGVTGSKNDSHDHPKPVESWLTDMDGVLVHEEQALPGASEFIAALQEHGRRFLVLTNNSLYTARDLRARLLRSGIDVPEECIWTSALATAQFLADQKRRRGVRDRRGGATSALHDVGFVLNRT